MTSLIAWLGVDNRGPASIYLASDSRITWGSEAIKWDFGRKLFASTKYPEVLGYCGDVLFPSLILGQLVDLIDSDILFSSFDLPTDKWSKITSIVKSSFGEYPKDCRSGFTVVYCTRRNEGMNALFFTFKLEWRKSDNRWYDWGAVPLPKKSDIVDTFGSGRQSVEKWYSYWQKTTEAGTSRSVFSAFCDALASKIDPYSGGAPQLVGLYRRWPAKSIGVVYQKQRYLLGVPVEISPRLDAVDWRNSLFECCDWRTMELKENAQKHKRPGDLGKA